MPRRTTGCTPTCGKGALALRPMLGWVGVLQHLKHGWACDSC